MMYQDKPPASSRGFISDKKQVARLLHPNRGTTELALKVILMKEYGWTAERVANAVTAAHVANIIRWVPYHGWCAGGRPT